MENKKSQAAMDFLMSYGWAILSAIILIIMIVVFISLPEDTDISLDKQCLAEKLCWDNGYEFYYMNVDGFLTPNRVVECYETTEKGYKLLHEFIKINWTALDQKYVCKG